MADLRDRQETETEILQRRLDRERRARLQAELIAEQALRDVYQEQQAVFKETAARQRLETEHIAKIAAEQLRVVHVTMRTVQDIVNNGLNQLQLLRLDAEGHVPQETLSLFDAAIRETSLELRALGDLEAYAEKQMVVGMGLDLGSKERR
jgi:hypothetical protein